MIPPDGGTTGVTPGADGGTTDAGTPTIGADGGPICMPMSQCTKTPKATQACLTTVDAKLVLADGTPATGIPILVCGTDICTGGAKSGADGTVHLAPCLPFTSPAFKLFADPPWASFATLLAGQTSYSLGNITVTPLPTMGTTMDGVAGGAFASNGVTLTLAANTTLKFDFEHMSTDQRLLRAVAVPATGLPGALAGVVDAAWALSPLNTKLTPAAQIQVPNPKNWMAGAQVDFYLNGTDAVTTPPPAPWGQWGKIGTGTVSMDGQSITLPTSAGGLPEIAMVGVKLH